jgi:NAD+ diphosphatase
MASLFDGLPHTEASSLHGFSGNRIDRRSEKRDDEAVPTALADPAARLYMFGGEQAVLRTDRAEPTFTLAEAEALGARRDAMILLGWTAEGPRLALTLPDVAPVEAEPFRLTDLRTLAAPIISARWPRPAASATGTSSTASAASAAPRA